MRTSKWLGSKNCDICHKPIEQKLYDAKMIRGSWAVMCHECWSQFSFRILGVGRGQCYEQQVNGDFHKVENK